MAPLCATLAIKLQNTRRKSELLKPPPIQSIFTAIKKGLVLKMIGEIPELDRAALGEAL